MKNLINIVHSSKLKLFLILFILFALYIFISATSYADTVSNNISNSVFRLHVLANSDSKEDQELKYLVRDKLLEYMNSLSINMSSKEEIIQIVNDHQEDFKKISLETIKENGFDYNVNISIDSSYFPTKTYGDISLPAGVYDALKVEIGNSEGKNWWCVMFPPLCFVDISTGIVPDDSKEIIKNSLTDEEFSLVNSGLSDSSYEDTISFKFKLIELLNSSKQLSAKN